TARGDLGRAVLGQLDIFIEADVQDCAVAVLVQRLTGDGADLDPAHAHITADGQAVDIVEGGSQVDAAAAGADIGRAVGENQEDGRKGKNHSADDGFNDITAHSLLLHFDPALETQ